MNYTTIDTLESANQLSEKEDKMLYLLRPNGTDATPLYPSNNFGTQFHQKILSAFVDDNFPHFKVLPLNDRVDFGNYLVFKHILESESHVFINTNFISLDNECLSLYLQNRYPGKAYIEFKDAESPQAELGGLSVKALFDIGIIEIRGASVTYPIKVATTNERPYEAYTGKHGFTGHTKDLLQCA